MARITLHALEVWAHHGVQLDEQRTGQPFLVHVSIQLDTSAAVASDDLHDTVDYAGLSQEVADAAREPRADLIETVAHRVAERVLGHDDRIEAAEVTIEKPHAPLPVPAAGVAVTVHRER